MEINKPAARHKKSKMKLENIKQVQRLIKKIEEYQDHIDRLKEAHNIRIADNQNSIDYKPSNIVDLSQSYTDPKLVAIQKGFIDELTQYYLRKIDSAKEQLKEL